jgi:DNA-binding NarL/FixJ family response regulator
MEGSGGNLPEAAGVNQRISVCVVAMHQIVLSALHKTLDFDSVHTISTTPVIGSSRREREIIDVLLLSLSNNKEIASRLNISERTVKFHVSNLLVKFNLKRRADLMLVCYQSGQTLTERSSLPTPQISWRLQ